MSSFISALLQRHQFGYHPVVRFNPATLSSARVDLSLQSGLLPSGVAGDLADFTARMEALRASRGVDFLFGGYNELRDFYQRSELFDAGEEPRRLHLGVDIWGPVGTPVYAFMGGMVHSVAYNEAFADYGATMILLHQLEGVSFYSLYGHISKRDIAAVAPGQYVVRGQEIAHFGEPEENGQWPPHLHFQLILDMGGRQGDYPGVCRFSEREEWLANSPDPAAVLGIS